MFDRAMFFRWMRMLLLCTIGTIGQAQELSTLNWLGFTADGRYAALEEFGVGEGQQAYSHVVLMDAQQNQELVSSNRRTLDATIGLPLLRQQNMAYLNMYAKNAKFGELGLPLYRQKLSADALKKREFVHTIRFDNYIVTLQQDSDLNNPCEDLDVNPKRLSVILQYKDQVLLIHEDQQVPSGRGCALDYSIEQIYQYQNQLALILRVIQPAANRTRNARYMLVTTILPTNTPNPGL